MSIKQEAPRGALGKRKERGPPEGPALLLVAPAKAELRKPAHLARLTKPPLGNNKILAGYLAHEFLTYGTLLGEQLEPSRKDQAWARADPKPARRYGEASHLMMTGGVHIPGVINPAQLGRWLHIKE